MTIEQLLAENTRLSAAWDAVQDEIRTAQRRYKRTRDPDTLRGWDRSLAAQYELMAALSTNAAQLRDVVNARPAADPPTNPTAAAS